MKILQENRKVRYNYTILDRFTAGIKLLTSEVKSIRGGNANISSAHCVFKSDGLYVIGLHISEDVGSDLHQHQPLRERKLLLTKKELKSLKKGLKDSGTTIVPYEMGLSSTGYIKLNIALVKGKKLHDKRNSIKERDMERELNRKLK